PSSRPYISSRSLHDALPIYRLDLLAGKVRLRLHDLARAVRRILEDTRKSFVFPILGQDFGHEIQTVTVGKGQNLLEKYRRIGELDRKSTRLNSSHVAISYAV